MGGARATGGDADRRMRVALSCALIVLVAANSTLALLPPTASPPTSSPRQGEHHVQPVDTTTTTVPDAVAVMTRPAGFGDDCGFSLQGGTFVAPVGHCTVMEVGDSLGNDLGWGLAREVSPISGLDLVQLDKSSTGLANSSFYDWPAEMATDLSLYHPQLVLICLGGNDEQGMEVGGSALQFPTAAWQNSYLVRVRQLISEATRGGAFVLWVGLPIMEQPSYSNGIQTLDGLYQEAASSEPNASFVSTWSLFANPERGFQSTALVNGAAVTLRQPDGIHDSLAGEDVVATYVLHQVSSLFHVRLVPTDPASITGW
jgi:uncharacterized protein